MIVTLTGANDFARKAELTKLISAFVAEHTDFGLERFDGEEATANAMRGGLSSLPFLTAKKMVVLYEPGKQKAFAEHIGSILQEVPDATDVIIVEPKLDKRLSYYKTLKKATDFREFTELDANGLARWVAEYVKTQGGSITAADARLLVDRVGGNQQMVSQELQKLLTYSPSVTGETIRLLTEPLPQSTVFELLDAAFSGNTQRTMELYREQRSLKVEPQAIIAMLAWQLHILALIKTADARSPDAIAREGKLNPYVVRKTSGLARRLSLGGLKAQIQALLNLDLRLKSVAIDADDALQLYLLRLSS